MKVYRAGGWDFVLLGGQRLTMHPWVIHTHHSTGHLFNRVVDFQVLLTLIKYCEGVYLYRREVTLGKIDKTKKLANKSPGSYV